MLVLVYLLDAIRTAFQYNHVIRRLSTVPRKYQGLFDSMKNQKEMIQHSEESLPIFEETSNDKRSGKWRKNLARIVYASVTTTIIIAIALFSMLSFLALSGAFDKDGSIKTCLQKLTNCPKVNYGGTPHVPDSLCPLIKKIDPTEYIYNSERIQEILHDKEFRKQSVGKLAEAIRVPTELYDSMDLYEGNDGDDLIAKDPRWKSFKDFHEYLRKTFPKVHDNLKIDTVNKFSKIYTWEGKTDKKPLLLTAHMDVVPVQRETLDQWTFPPFKGVYDGDYVYGRGSSDCKNLLVSLMEVLEILLSEDKFSPERTLIVAFGSDEETYGNGAREISNFLRNKYGPDSMYALIDEGVSGVIPMEGIKLITPGTAEKGIMDSHVELFTPGGHSSLPPDHTLIGLLSKLISKVEDNQFNSIITKANPFLSQLQCVAQYSNSIDKSLKKDILRSQFDAQANKELLSYLEQTPETKYMVRTSQAADVMSGGTKVNALPEHTSVVINHRIAVEETVESTSQKISRQIEEFAREHDLGLIDRGNPVIMPTEKGYFNYTIGRQLDPAPVSPPDGKVWNTFGGSLKYLYEDLVFPEDKSQYIFAPSLMPANTDTKCYWDLTRNIYRYQPGISMSFKGVHTVDEKVFFDSHLVSTAFYYYYIQVVDKESD